ESAWPRGSVARKAEASLFQDQERPRMVIRNNEVRNWDEQGSNLLKTETRSSMCGTHACGESSPAGGWMCTAGSIRRAVGRVSAAWDQRRTTARSTISA